MRGHDMHAKEDGTRPPAHMRESGMRPPAHIKRGLRPPAPEERFFGHAACAGCAASLVVRHAMKVLGPHAVAALPAGCMSAVAFNFPQMAFTVNAAITPFASCAAVASGIEAGLRAQNKKPDDCTVVAIAGDGGTADIGLASLSGAIDRGDDILYICYDNEAYMNTGIQESSLSPRFSATTTSPAGAVADGTATEKKRLFEIVAAHGIPYAATASAGCLPDLLAKLERAAVVEGTRFIHVLAPCPTGWGHAPELSCEIARQAVDCGLWYLAEYDGESGQTHLTHDPGEFSDLGAYLKGQRRFAHLDDADIAAVAAMRDAAWERMRRAWVSDVAID